MKKTLIITTLGMVSILLLSTSITCAGELDAVDHKVVICAECDENLKVEETITLQGNTDEYIDTIEFWVQSGATNVNIFVNNTEVTSTQDGNKYTINISSMEIKMNTELTVKISYILDKNTQNFQKELLQNTDSIEVAFGGKIIYSSTNLVIGESFTLPLYKSTETPTQTLTTYYVIIALLIVIIVILLIYNVRHRKPSEIREMASATEELLTTKKTLLMSLLKDIEKQHRAKEISDDTYHKLKEQYKRETVETMKQLEDITKSKVK